MSGQGYEVGGCGGVFGVFISSGRISVNSIIWSLFVSTGSTGSVGGQ